jgi:isopentenyl-diphosphate delta-isomerase
MNNEAAAIERRKGDHIRINLDEDVRAKGVGTGFDRYRFIHTALPNLDLEAVDTSIDFLGHHLQAPILISCMTGGIEQGREINRRLAAAAQALGCAMGVGSQRAAVENPELEQFYRVRDVAPDILLFANLGAVQLNYQYGIDECQRAVEMIEADALVLHLNPLQEAVQTEGNSNFAGLLDRIEEVCHRLQVPVIIKEVGWGISADVARQLADADVAAIDVGGAGGTSWSEVERHRGASSQARRISATFSSWGIPTAESVVMARSGAPDLPLIASGGMANGIDVAKAIRLGATLGGFASPLLKAASESEEAAHELLSALVTELRISMFCTGAADIAALSRVGLLPATTSAG